MKNFSALLFVALFFVFVVSCQTGETSKNPKEATEDSIKVVPADTTVNVNESGTPI